MWSIVNACQTLEFESSIEWRIWFASVIWKRPKGLLSGATEPVLELPFEILVWRIPIHQSISMHWNSFVWIATVQWITRLFWWLLETRIPWIQKAPLHVSAWYLEPSRHNRTTISASLTKKRRTQCINIWIVQSWITSLRVRPWSLYCSGPISKALPLLILKGAQPIYRLQVKTHKGSQTIQVFESHRNRFKLSPRWNHPMKFKPWSVTSHFLWLLLPVQQQ